MNHQYIVSDIIFVQVHRCYLYRKSALHISKMASQALIYKQVTLIQNVVNKNMLTKNPEQYLLFCLTCQNIRVNSIQSFKPVENNILQKVICFCLVHFLFLIMCPWFSFFSFFLTKLIKIENVTQQ